MGARMKDSSGPDELMEAFKGFDKEGNGIVSAQELRNIMMNFGEPMTEEETDELIKEADTAKDGKINYKAFVEKLLKD